MKRNIWFIILFVGLIFTFCCRYTNVDTDIVWNGDSELAFSTDNEVLEQTWQPSVKMISGVTVPCYSDADFECDLNLKIFNDNYSEVLLDTTLEKHVFEKDNSNKITFTFPKTKVIPGERYRFQLTYHNPSANATLMIASGTNYGGCSIDNVDTGEGAAFCVTTVKYSKIFWLVAILLPVCAFSLLFMLLFDRKFEETAGLAMALEGLTIYAFSLFEHMETGIYVVYLLSVISLIASVVICNLKKKGWKDLVSPGMVIFFAFVVIILLTSYGDWLGARDDIKHWGMAVRDMFYYNTQANHVNSTMLIQRYFPFTTIMEYVFVYMNGMFSENILLIAFQFLMLCEMVILTTPLQNGVSIKRILPVLVMMVCVPVTYFDNISSAIMVDPFQMSVMVYVLVCFLSESLTVFNIFRISCGLVVLTISKDIGIVFSGIIAFIMFGDIAIKQIRERKLAIKQLLFPVCCVFLVLFAYVSWQIYLTVPNQTGCLVTESDQSVAYSQEIQNSTSLNENEEDIVDVQEEYSQEERMLETGISASGISLQGIRDLLDGSGKEYQYKVIDNYIVALFEGEDFLLGGQKLPFYKVIALILISVFVLGFIGLWGDKKERIFVFCIVTFVSSLLLVCFLLVTYLFTFPQGDAMVLACMDRYLAPYICMMVICVSYLIYENYPTHKWGSLIIAVLSVVMAINMPLKDLVVECNERPEYSVEKNTYGYDRIATILRSVAKRGEKVQYICSGGDGYNEYLFRNAVCPVISFHQWNDIVSDRDIYNKYAELALQQEDQGDVYDPEIVSYEEFSGRLQEVQYVVIFHADDSFVESYADLFGGPQMISDGSIYSVEENSEGIVCNLIGKTGIKGWRKK